MIMEAFPYHPSSRISSPPITKSDAVKHFMPLNNGASPLDGPNRSIFSAPPFNYSSTTNQLLADMMKESRLTFTQRSGLQSILRSGEPLPLRPADIYRQELARHRHAERARSLGIPVMPPNFNANNRPPLSHATQLYHKFGNGGRRTYESIQSSERAAAAIPKGPRRYVGVDKEKEKIRFAHHMATGKNPPEPPPIPSELCVRRLQEEEEDKFNTIEPLETRFLELVAEVRDRLEFMEQTESLGRSKDYHPVITAQIQQLLSQMKAISPERTAEWVGLLQLDKLLGKSRKPSSQIADILNHE